MSRLSSHVFTRCLCLVAVLPLTGCGYSFMASRDTNPVIQEHLGPIWGSTRTSVLSMNAGRRTVMMRYTPLDPQGGQTKYVPAGTICAEPPPDVAEALASALSASVVGTTPSGSDVGAAIARNFGSSQSSLLYRTQGLQFLRDNLHDACQRYMNGVLTLTDYNSEVATIRDQAAKLIEVEVNQQATAQASYWQGIASVLEKQKATAPAIPNAAADNPLKAN